MKLIADSGSSKTDWRLIDGEEISQFSCKGLNPDFNSESDVFKEVSLTFDSVSKDSVDQLIFYGSGCSTEGRKEIIVNALSLIFKQATLQVEHDLLGAARAACGNKAGLVGILGTGSNCCLFDGTKIHREFRSGGFIIGDEGGGVDLGKRLIKAYIESTLPKDLNDLFEKRYRLTVDNILEKLYKESQPNQFLASFARFVFHHKEHPFISKLIHDSFTAYIKTQVLRYPEYKGLELNLVGSIAFYFHEYIRMVASEHGVTIGTIIEKPISGLSLYHSELS